MSGLSRSWRLWGWDKPIPTRVDEDNLRPFILFRQLAPVTALIHLGFIFLFYLVGAPLLALYNVVSVVIWLGATWANERGHLLTAGILGMVELWGFCTLAALSFGPAAGFQYYLFCAMLVPFLFPKSYGLHWKLGLVACSVALFLVLTIQGRHTTLLVESSALPSQVFLVFNVVCEGAILAAAGFFFSNAVYMAEAERDREHQKAKRLLYNVLPQSIADELTDSFKTIADRYEHVSVLFCDLVGFTRLAERTSPEGLVDLLNVVFSRFDDIADRYGLEKIKTIGDAYMVVAGVPEARPDHADALASFALDIVSEIEGINQELDSALDVRVGIHSGSVVAGIIGKRKFSFDLWGDCVNTASRMESHGEPGRIQISQQTRDLLTGSFVTTERGTIPVKGKGDLTTHFLVSR